GAVLHRAADLVYVGAVDHRIHAVGVQVHAQGDQVHVAGALPLSEQAPFHPVGAGHHGQFRRCHGGTAVVVRMHREGDVLAAGQVAAHPFDLVGVHVGGGALDGGGQVQHDLTALLRAPDVHHRLADLQGIVQFGVDEHFRGVLVPEHGLRPEDLLGIVHHVLGAAGGQFFGGLAVIAEDHVAASATTGGVPLVAGAVVASRSLRKTTSRKMGAVALYRCTVARGAPSMERTVRSMSSCRAWVSTEMVTSSGTASSSMMERTKS